MSRRKIVEEINQVIDRLVPYSSLSTLNRAVNTIAEMPKSVYDLLKPSLESILVDWQSKVLTSRWYMADNPTTDAEHLLQSIHDQIAKLRDAYRDPAVKEYMDIWDGMPDRWAVIDGERVMFKEGQTKLVPVPKELICAIVAIMIVLGGGHED